jgi:ribosomal protein S18 acetylase RimI-like enzyme
MLRVEQDNTRARCFYEAHGFRHTGEYAEEFYGHIINKLEMMLRPRFRSSNRVQPGSNLEIVTTK